MLKLRHCCYIYIIFLVFLLQGLVLSEETKDDDSAQKPTKNVRLWTAEELSEYDGKSDPSKLALSILGEVFDVSKGDKHYGPGMGYHFFTGKDGTRAFVTGEFNKEGLIPDIEGLTGSQMLAIEEWLLFYRKDYVPMGKLIGHYYDETGAPTEAQRTARIALRKGREEKKREDQFKKILPGCNSKYSSAEGKTFWCDVKSGGISRDWVGVIREFTNPDTLAKRCVCVPPDQLDLPGLALYDGCPPKSSECYWPPEKPEL